MRDETIRDLLRKLNNGKGKDLIFKNSIGENVELAKVWIWMGGEYFYKDQNFFLIKNQDGKYVSAVYGLNKFHWYTLYEERGKGYPSIALRNSIIPFLWGPYRQEIHEPFEISISRGIGPKNFESSFRLAKSLGFKVDEENDYKTKLLLSYDDFATEELATPVIIPDLDKDSGIRLLEKGQSLMDLFLQIKGELEIRLGVEVLDDFDQILDLKYKLEGMLDDHFMGRNVVHENQKKP
jgi:hypothetical protein